MSTGPTALALALAVLVALLLVPRPPAARAHGEAEERAEETYALSHPERPRAVPRGVAALRAATGTAPAASYVSAAPPPAPASVPADALRAGVGRADLTPPRVGYFLGGWTRADRVGHGVSTRLTTSALVLERGGRRVALVAMSDFAVPQGLQQAVAAKVADLGLSERTIVLSATHTHSGTGGYANESTLNTAAPGAELILRDPASLAGLIAPAPADPQLYTFIVGQIATAIRRAAATMGPAAAGWGHTELTGLTRNRSLVARLADFGTTDAAQVPYERTIDPNVDVLRVDRLVGPTCAGQVARSARRATLARRRARTASRAATRARRAATRARRTARARGTAAGTRRTADRAGGTARRGHGGRVAQRRYRTALRRSHAAARRSRRLAGTARRAARSARAWAGRPCARDGRLPIGGWANFANHGTVVKSEFGLYSADHGGVAALQFEARVRAAAGVPADQPVVGVYGSADQGDQSAGLDHSGPAGADLVGRTEGDAFFRAWKDAEGRLSATPAFGVEWTRFCFCGRATSDGGRVAEKPQIGAPFLTGSEEGRGPLYDLTGIPFEGLRAPALDPAQGDKLVVPIGSWSAASPMTLARIGDGAIVTMPGEPTVGVGERTRAAVLAATKDAGVRRVSIAGLANDYLNYITTPEEYDAQQYEGASTVFGRHEGTFLTDRAGELGTALAGGTVQLEQRDYDASNGVRADGPGYAAGATSSRILAQPVDVERLGLATVAWSGDPTGADKPVDTAFVTVQRQTDAGWVAADNDLGTAIAWRVDGDGRHTATWNPPENAPLGRYRFVVTGRGYAVTSGDFAVARSTGVEARPRDAGAGRAAVQVGFALPRVNLDLVARPSILQGGTVAFRVGGRTVEAPVGRDGVATVDAPSGAEVVVPAGAVHDPDGNVNGRSVALR